jgi:hypothetical protein
LVGKKLADQGKYKNNIFVGMQKQKFLSFYSLFSKNQLTEKRTQKLSVSQTKEPLNEVTNTLIFFLRSYVCTHRSMY